MKPFLALAALIITVQPLAAQPPLDELRRQNDAAILSLQRRILESDARIRELDRLIDQIDRRRALDDLRDDIDFDALMREDERHRDHFYGINRCYPFCK